MEALHLFAALRKQSDFPDSSVDIKVNGVKYDVVLPATISRLLVAHFTDAESGYVSVKRYCDLWGIKAIRARPTLLDDEYAGSPTYAHSFNGVENDNQGSEVIGYVAFHLAISPLAARTMYRRARVVNRIDPDLAEYVRDHAGYFHECGGFDLLRIRYYFDKKDRYQTMLDIDETEPEKLLRP